MVAVVVAVIPDFSVRVTDTVIVVVDVELKMEIGVSVRISFSSSVGVPVRSAPPSSLSTSRPVADSVRSPSSGDVPNR